VSGQVRGSRIEVLDWDARGGKMKDAGVDLVVACMDSNAVVLLAEEMTKQRMDAIQYIANGYDADLVVEELPDPVLSD
jgi:hypothetical protein